MFKSNRIKEEFKAQAGAFDVEEPSDSHRINFLAKLNQVEVGKPNTKTTKQWWQYGVAAILILSIGIMFVNDMNNNADQVVEKRHEQLPQEVMNVQYYMETNIKKELAKIELERNDDTEAIINAAFNQLEFLEQEQKVIEEKLKANYDKRLVKSLIDNFNFRIQLLENVMQQIEISKEIKSNNHQYEII